MSTDTNPTSPNTALEEEIRKLGENIGALLRTMWECEERKSIEREVTSILENVNQTLSQATEQLQSSQGEIRDKVDQVRRSLSAAWETAHGPQIVREMELGLVDTLRKFNEALSRRAQPAPAHEAAPQTDSETPKPE